MSLPEGLTRLLQSRKFWVLIASVCTAIGTRLSGQITTLEMVILIIGALAVYSTGIALVDAGAARAQQQAQPTPALVAEPTGDSIAREKKNGRELTTPEQDGYGPLKGGDNDS